MPGPDRNPANRREIILFACTVVTALATIGQCTGATPGIADWIENNLDENKTDRLRDSEALARFKDIFFRGLGDSFAFHPGSVKLNPDAKAHDDWAAISAICSAFEIPADLKNLAYPDLLNTGKGLISIGSPATNDISSACLTCAKTNQIKAPDGRKYALRWVHATNVPERTVRRRLDDRWIVEPNYEIIDTVSSSFPLKSLLNRDRHPMDSYLLFSKIPHPSRPGAAACIWAGNIGPGTEAVKHLLATPEILRSDMMGKLWEFSWRHDFFQALFKIDQIELSEHDGRHVPLSCRLIDFAAAIPIL